MLKLVTICVLAFLAGAAMAQESTTPIGDETKAADQGTDKADSKPVAAVAAADDDGVAIPAGFKKKKRGDLVLYCIKGKATGTRFPTESCYDEAGLKDYILKREASNRDFEQSRSVCSNPSVCASP